MGCPGNRVSLRDRKREIFAIGRHRLALKNKNKKLTDTGRVGWVRRKESREYVRHGVDKLRGVSKTWQSACRLVKKRVTKEKKGLSKPRQGGRPPKTSRKKKEKRTGDTE